MVFSNAIFLLLFLPLSLAVYYFPFMKNMAVRNAWLLLVSLGFYAWGEPLYVFLMILSICINYVMGCIVEKYARSKKGKHIVAIACFFNLGMLFVFKYLGWISELIFGSKIEGNWISELTLPIGISFYTFQTLSYVIDVYRGKDKAQKNILNTGLYIAFFPQLIAGPIVRYGSIAEQLENRTHSFEKFSDGVCRFIIGLSKKALLANQVAVVADAAFAKNPSEISVAFAWLGALCFMLQIYFDFSGYSDMAIGLGKMFGFTFNENFNYPYVSKSIAEYWRRWHISLGEWFRDYVYYPLSLGPAVKIRKRLKDKVSRKTNSMITSIFVLFVVWMLTGIWHGANMTFVVWGLIQFVFIVWETYRKPMKNKRLGAALGFVSTYFIVLATKVVFKADSLTHAISYYGSMLKVGGNKLIDQYAIYYLDQYKWFIIVAFVLSFPIIECINQKIIKSKKTWLINLSLIIKAILLLLLIFLCMIFVVGGGYNPFIYFNF